MKQNSKTDKGLDQLGLPPMTLAECSENIRRRRDMFVFSLVRNISILLVLIIICAVSFLVLTKLLDDTDNVHTTEILLVTNVKNPSNVTLQKDDLEISLQVKNNTSNYNNNKKRKKRHVGVSETTDETIAKFKDKDYQKARETILNHSVLCNADNKNEICKNLVMKLKSVTDNKHEDSDVNSKVKLEPKSENIKKSQQARDIHSPDDVTNRDSLLPNFEGLLHGRGAYEYPSGPYVKPVPAYLPSHPYQGPPHPYQSPAHPLIDTCLLARLLKPHPHLKGLYGHHPEYVPHQSYGYPEPHLYREVFNEARDVEPAQMPPHPQDIDIVMHFLVPKPDIGTTEKTSSSSRRDSQCPAGTLPCDNGDSCVSENQWCNGEVDCLDVSDESKCSCKSRVDKFRLCDGYYDCPFGEDEMGCYGCGENAFSCEDLDVNTKSSCFTREQRCNNVMDCPNNRDEIDCNMLSPSLLKKPLFATSNTEGFLQRNFKGDWFAVCKNPYMWAHDACRRETGLILRPPFIQYVPVDPTLRINYLNAGPGGTTHNTDSCLNSSAIYVTCPELLCGTRILTTSQLLKESAAIENHLYGRNKRFLLNEHYNMPYYRQLISGPNYDIMNYEANLANTMGQYALRKKRAQSRVVGGRPSKPAAWPWVAAMYRDGMFHCGGVILNQHWVLSAAHCVHEFWTHYYEVQVGMLRRFSFSPQEQNHLITHIIVNQKYDQEDMKNDLSLLRVKNYIQFSRWVRPICLPGPNTAGQDWIWGPAPGTLCTTVGWGATVEHGPDPDHMREVEVPIWANCKHSEDQQGKEICAGPEEGGKDACQGDSGGPLLCRNPINLQQWYVTGIVSHGDGCARKGEPGVYTRVSLFVKWIRYNIGSKILPSIQPLQKCPGFKCTSGISKCLPNKRVCDKIVDCLNGEDELNCNTMRSFENMFFARESQDNDTEIKKKEEVQNQNIEKLRASSSESKDKKIPDIKNSNNTLNNNKLFEDLKHPSTIEISISTSMENSEDVTDDPSSSSEESHESKMHATTLPSLKVTVPKLALEARSSVLADIEKDSTSNTRASDIHEDWGDSETSSTAMPTINKITELLSIPDLKITTLSPPIRSNNATGRKESKSLTVELLPLLENATRNMDNDSFNFNMETTTSTVKPQVETVKSNTTVKKITHLDEQLDVIHKIEDIVLSELQPAKIRKKHLTPKDFECRRIFQTIPYSQRCDHKADCEDGTDELSCTCTDYLFAFDKKLLCDGVYDCADGQDETDCFSCPENRFLCKKSQICVPIKNVCDGRPQCPQGEDEIDCFTLSNGLQISFDNNERPKIALEGYITKKVSDQWQILCENNMSTEEQEQTASHICRYLGFSSANRYLLKHLNIKDELLKPKSNDERSRRDTRAAARVHFTYRETSDNANTSDVTIAEPQVLKEECVPNVKKTCMSLYVYCDHSLFTDFNFSDSFLFGRTSDTKLEQMWPWIAKVFVDGNYKCTGVLLDQSLVLVSHSCLWDSSISQHHTTVVLGSHRTLNATRGPYEQIYQVNGKREIYRSNVILLHLNGSAHYSPMVKPMVIQSTATPEHEPITCVAVGQNGHNQTITAYVNETRENCYPHNKCYKMSSEPKLCPYGMVSSHEWAGIISCQTEQGWYPSASFVDSRGECGISTHIIGTDIENLKLEIKHASQDKTFLSKKLDIADKCDGIRCGRGKCVNMCSTCNGVRDCEDGNDESEEACEKKHSICTRDPHNKDCECSIDQFRCHNGKCIPKEMFNNGHDDCGDRTDEPEESNCSKYLARVMPSRLCDGILHCKDRSDEDPMFCKCFAKQTYSCGKIHDIDHCVAPDMVCDGVPDCPNGKDEHTCIGLSGPPGTPYGKGQVIVRSHGVWHTKCYPNQKRTKSELEEICRELGFISGHAKELDVTDNLTPHRHNNVVLDSFSDVVLNNKTRIQLRNTHQPLARAIFDDKLTNCHSIFIECL